MRLSHLLLLALIFFTTSCQSDSVVSDLTKNIENLKKQIQSSKIDETAGEEVEKLFVFEYVVKEFQSTTSTDTMESELNKLGLDRWECFDTQIVADKLKVFCKRKPKTYLRYLTRMF